MTDGTVPGRDHAAKRLADSLRTFNAFTPDRTPLSKVTSIECDVLEERNVRLKIRIFGMSTYVLMGSAKSHPSPGESYFDITEPQEAPGEIHILGNGVKGKADKLGREPQLMLILVET